MQSTVIVPDLSTDENYILIKLPLRAGVILCDGELALSKNALNVTSIGDILTSLLQKLATVEWRVCTWVEL